MSNIFHTELNSQRCCFPKFVMAITMLGIKCFFLSSSTHCILYYILYSFTENKKQQHEIRGMAFLVIIGSNYDLSMKRIWKTHPILKKIINPLIVPNINISAFFIVTFQSSPGFLSITVGLKPFFLSVFPRKRLTSLAQLFLEMFNRSSSAKRVLTDRSEQILFLIPPNTYNHCLNLSDLET